MYTRHHLGRRDFLRSTAAATLSMGVAPPLLAHIHVRPEPVPPIDDPRLREFANRALDAARQAGAAYADVRLTYTKQRSFSGSISTTETLAVGVRSLVDGYWGFASSPVWHPDEMIRLGRSSVALARNTGKIPTRRVTLAKLGSVPDGHWTMPIQIDPFDVPIAEVLDFMGALVTYTGLQDALLTNLRLWFSRQDQVFGSTDGGYCTQRVYLTRGHGDILVERNGQRRSAPLSGLTPAGAGWEYIYHAPLKNTIVQTISELRSDLTLPILPIDVGKYPVVLDAESVAQLVSSTIGLATELDRALGYEANASGTSYIKNPLQMLGNFKIGSPLLNITANRNDPGAAATVRWDDEGVTPDRFTLVKNGILTDMQTTRESAEWIMDDTHRREVVPTSRGCAHASSALESPLTQTANLSLQPGTVEQGFQSLVEGFGNGIAFKRVLADIDFQQSGGLGSGVAYEVKRGKRTAIYAGAGILFRASELWNNLNGLGGLESQRRFGMNVQKGEPPQESFHSVTAVPSAFKELTIVDIRRKA